MLLLVLCVPRSEKVKRFLALLCALGYSGPCNVSSFRWALPLSPPKGTLPLYSSGCSQLLAFLHINNIRICCHVHGARQEFQHWTLSQMFIRAMHMTVYELFIVEPWLQACDMELIINADTWVIGMCRHDIHMSKYHYWRDVQVWAVILVTWTTSVSVR